jgi:hypothetical protein
MNLLYSDQLFRNAQSLEREKEQAEYEAVENSPAGHAAYTYRNRNKYGEEPDGQFVPEDGVWYASRYEFQDCCEQVQCPSRRNPYTQKKHCRTKKHIAAIFGVTTKEMDAAAKILWSYEEP